MIGRVEPFLYIDTHCLRSRRSLESPRPLSLSPGQAIRCLFSGLSWCNYLVEARRGGHQCKRRSSEWLRTAKSPTAGHFWRPVPRSVEACGREDPRPSFSWSSRSAMLFIDPDCRQRYDSTLQSQSNKRRLGRSGSWSQPCACLLARLSVPRCWARETHVRDLAICAPSWQDSAMIVGVPSDVTTNQTQDGNRTIWRSLGPPSTAEYRVKHSQPFPFPPRVSGSTPMGLFLPAWGYAGRFHPERQTASAGHTEQSVHR